MNGLRPRLHTIAEVVVTVLTVLVACFATGCEEAVDPDAPWSAEERLLLETLALTEKLPPSPGNRVADDPRARDLGRSLFFDVGLSGRGEVACASCHVPHLYFTDARATATGQGPLPFNTPSVLGAGAFTFLTWNGRSDSVWAQALGPLEHPREMDGSRVEIARHIARVYREPYEALFGPMPPVEDEARFPSGARPRDALWSPTAKKRWQQMVEEDREAINRVFSNVGKALESYQRGLRVGPSPFDRYVEALRAGDANGGGHLSRSARRGLRQFIGPAGCVNCHHGPFLTDREFHNVGLRSPDDGLRREDRAAGAVRVKADPFRCGGNYSDSDACDELRFLNPAFEDFRGAFKTPSLRNVAMTPPYMHAGQLRTLEEVVEFYRRLPGQPSVGHRDAILRPLGRGVRTDELVAFLRALTGALPDATAPEP